MSNQFSRRSFLEVAGLAAGSTLAASPVSGFFENRRPKVAAVFTVFTYRSHAHVLLENFLQPYLFNGKRTDPGVDVVSFYADQTPSGDMSRDVSRKYGIPIFQSIDEALCLGGKELAVDAVLSIGEHGNYPRNKLGQVQYPRKRFFDEIVGTMKRSGRFVPIFNDKHLSYDWSLAKQMYDETVQHGIPLLAGSSVPLAQRRPPLELPRGAEFEEAVSIHGGPLESYDFHGLEVLQSMVESRRGGESGVSSVEFLSGNDVWRAAADGRFSLELANAAMTAEFGEPLQSLTKIEGERDVTPHCLLLRYKDGFRAAVLKVGHNSARWNFACRRKNASRIHATSFRVGPWENRCLFKALSHAIQHHFIHRKSPYPPERTLLATGILEASMKSRSQSGEVIATPHLEFAYDSPDFTAMRESGESWKLLTDDTPEPRGIHSARPGN
ncbi:MAG: hypothetical protein ACYTGL_05500 [Planctomycetota bacterium]